MLAEGAQAFFFFRVTYFVRTERRAGLSSYSTTSSSTPQSQTKSSLSTTPNSAGVDVVRAHGIMAEVNGVVLLYHKVHTSGTRYALPLVRPMLSWSEVGLGRTVKLISTIISEGLVHSQCNH